MKTMTREAIECVHKPTLMPRTYFVYRNILWVSHVESGYATATDLDTGMDVPSKNIKLADDTLIELRNDERNY